MKRLIASLAMGGSLLGGIAVPLTLTAQSAHAASDRGEARENASPNLALKAQHALIRNGNVDRVGAESCTIVITPNGAVICV